LIGLNNDCLQKYGISSLTKIKKIAMRSVGFIGCPKYPQNNPKKIKKNIFLIFVSEAHFCKAVGRHYQVPDKRKIIKARIMLA